ncbi:MAG: FtsX-like permease family protein [Candidatus Pacebacteria bacterium]|nr:FtsX-like permease family protein [Candidatus Paceibacterota bacterium]
MFKFIKKRFFTDFKNSLRVGFFLALRQVKNSSKWTNFLIIGVMTLTFLNLVVVSGVLVGLIDGASNAVGKRFLKDIFISNLTEKKFILNTTEITEILRANPNVEGFSARYTEGGKIEANYKTKLRQDDIGDEVSAIFAGINPEDENKLTGIKSLLIEGEFINENDFDRVVLGSMLLDQYAKIESSSFPTLSGVGIGSKIRVKVGGYTREVTVKGIIKSKVDELDRRIFFPEKQFRNLIGRFDLNASEIAVGLKDGASPIEMKNYLNNLGFNEFAKIQTKEDAEPKFLKDIKKTFEILGNLISGIGLAVAAITIFIVIFINAITRRKYIGILKGIGVNARAIEIAYVFQSIFYALVGTIFGSILIFGFLKPYVDAHPINFPFSDGIIVATLSGTMMRVLVLFIATLIAGFLPARIVINRNTLDSILGR